jgi:hypothetical protein
MENSWQVIMNSKNKIFSKFIKNNKANFEMNFIDGGPWQKARKLPF